MLKNYIKIAWRNLLRHKVYSAINIFGLAIGIAACLLIFLYVQDELTYEKHFSKADRIFRVANDINLQGQTDKFALTPMALAPALKKDYPELEEAVRLMPIGKQTVWFDEKVFNEENLFFADSNFFKVFDYHFVKGNPETALSEPKTIVLTEALAEKYFGSAENAMDKMLKFSKNTHKVTGVIQDQKHSHIQVNALLSINSFDKQVKQALSSDWFRVSTTTYVLLRNANQQQDFSKKLDAFYLKRIAPWIKENKITASVKYHLIPLRDIHFNTDFTYDISPAGNLKYVY